MRILITGGSHGIGLSIARKLYNSDNTIFIVSRNPNVVKKEMPAIECITADLTYINQIKSVGTSISKLGIDILVNNVGGGGRWGNDDVLTTSEQVWKEVFNKNYETTRILTLSVLPEMINKNFGRIVTISSISGKESMGRPWFDVAKCAEISFMKSLSRRKDLVRHNITFNTVCPGAIYITGIGWDTMSDVDLNKFSESLPMGRMGFPSEVSNVVNFLCSNSASFVNGACITVDGGESRSY